jgi:uncharacterized protein (TIGR02302 family)
VTGPAITPDVPPPEPPREARLRTLIRRAQAALLWERIWPPLAAAGSVTLVFFALSWFGLFEQIPPLARAAGVLLFGVALFFALNPLVRIRMPDRAAALARIDRKSAARHRPATALSDPLASPAEDSVTRALWAAHRERMVRAADNLRAGAASPRLAVRDPRALRFLAVLAAFTAFVMAGGDRAPRTLSAFDWSSPAGGVPPRLDAWVAPPAYTGRPPIFLTAGQPDDARAAAPEAEDDTVHTVPSGSVLVVRASGGAVEIDAPGARELLPGENAPAAQNAPKPDTGAEIDESRFVLEQDTEITVDGTRTHLAWKFAVTADAPPKIAFRIPPRHTANGSLVLDYTAEDDYGFASAAALVVAQRTDADIKAETKPPRPLYGPPDIKLVLPQNGRAGPAVTNVDMVEHPWAGQRVAMTLLARDERGQEGRSETLETVLPERSFTQPLARALIEQRRTLALDAEARPRVLNALEALSLYPEKFAAEAAVYLGLRSAHARLFYARSDEDLRGVVDYLWEIALMLEEGDLAGFEADLKQAEQNLREALERNAPDEEIARLMNELRQALAQYLQEMARQMEQQPGQQTLPPGAQILTSEDLKRMLDQMENLARGGNRQAAQDMLAQLSEMMRNLQNARPGQMDEGSEAAMRALDELSGMIREQSELRDKTFGQRQTGGDQKPGAADRGALGKLGEQQGALKQRLEELTKELEGLGMEGNSSLGDAGEEMGAAEGHLGEGDANRAFNAQGRALDALREGTQGMAEQMMSGLGVPGQAEGGREWGQEDLDPLGRPTRARRYDPGSNVRVPGEIEAQRARRVLEELRRRISDPDRPQEELDYLERLLRD